MKRILVSAALAASALVAGMSPASAAVWCNDDPIVPLGTPVTYSVNVTVAVSTPVLWTQTYATASGSTYQRVAGGTGVG